MITLLTQRDPNFVGEVLTSFGMTSLAVLPDVRRSALTLDVLWWAEPYRLHLITQAFLVAMRLHALAALVLGNFCFPSFFKRAHSDFHICEARLNHLIRRIAT
jgi:hypothetical protein